MRDRMNAYRGGGDRGLKGEQRVCVEWSRSAKNRFRSEKDRHDHQAGSMRTRHEPGPEGQIPKTDAHTDPGRMSRAPKLPARDNKEGRRATDLEPSERDHGTDRVNEQYDHSNGECVSKGNRRKRSEYSPSGAVLKSERHRKEPSHAWVQTMPGAKQDQS